MTSPVNFTPVSSTIQPKETANNKNNVRFKSTSNNDAFVKQNPKKINHSLRRMAKL